jgi:hypothetical protein
MRALALAVLTLPVFAADQPFAAAAGPVDFQDGTRGFREASDCLSVVRQVAGRDQRHSGNRLDQQPSGKLLLAVDRQVDGCRSVTFVAEERLRPSASR